MCGIVGFTGTHQAAPILLGWTCQSLNIVVMTLQVLLVRNGEW